MAFRSISSVFATKAYKRTVTEDGDYYFFAGYYLIVQCDVRTDAGVVRDEFIYTDRSHLPKIFEKEPLSLVKTIESVGRINTIFWDHINTINLDELPDYVTNPDRPEYN